MSLERFCRKPLVSLKPEETVQQAAEEMRLRHVGAVLIVDGDGRPLGVVTDRDIVCRAVAQHIDPEKASLREIMSEGAVVLKEADSVDVAVHRMREIGVRRLPVVNPRGRAIGVVTLDDLVVLLTAELGEAAQAIRDNRGP